MPKRINNLFDKITSFENLILAAKKSRKGKKSKIATQKFDIELETNIINLQKEFRNFTYTTGEYKSFFINDSKKRLITAAPYKDRIVHHAIINVIGEVFEKSFIYDTYSCIKEKGTHKAIQRYKVFCAKNEYVLKCDVKKYFHNINHDILFGQIQRKIKCQNTLKLIKLIIASKYDKECDGVYHGIPIGNLTSQMFANIYLNDFDHYLKEVLKIKSYIRYCDDFVVFESDKKLLGDIRSKIIKYLDNLDLNIHENKAKIYKVNDGVNFLGFRIFKEYSLVNKNTVKRFKKKFDKKYKRYLNNMISFEKMKQSIQSWIGHVKHANSYKLRKSFLAKYIF
jgi:retron-type reverse transcriptase